MFYFWWCFRQMFRLNALICFVLILYLVKWGTRSFPRISRVFFVVFFFNSFCGFFINFTAYSVSYEWGFACIGTRSSRTKVVKIHTGKWYPRICNLFNGVNAPAPFCVILLLNSFSKHARTVMNMPKKSLHSNKVNIFRYCNFYCRSYVSDCIENKTFLVQWVWMVFNQSDIKWQWY